MKLFKIVSHLQPRKPLDFETIDLKKWDSITTPSVKDFFQFGVLSLCLGIGHWIREDRIDLFSTSVEEIIKGIWSHLFCIQQYSLSFNQSLQQKKFVSLNHVALNQALIQVFSSQTDFPLQTIILVLHNSEHQGHALTLQCRCLEGRSHYIYFDPSGINVERQEIRIGFCAESLADFVRVLDREIALMNRSNGIGFLRRKARPKDLSLDAMFSCKISLKNFDAIRTKTDYTQFTFL